MEKPTLRKPESASDSSVYETALSRTPSASIVTINQTDLKDEVFSGQNRGENYSSSSLSLTQLSAKETFTATAKTTRDFTTSPLSSLQGSSSSEIEELEMISMPNVQPLKKAASLSSSTETIEIVLKESSKRNDTATAQRGSSEASISPFDMEEGKAGIPRKEIETRLALKDSMSSVTLDLVKDTSEIKVRRNSDSSGDARTVRFSLQDTDSYPQEIRNKKKQAPDILKSSKSLHGRSELGDDDSVDEDSIESTNLEIGHVFVYMVVPPDGGYGWFVCLISFLSQIVIDGVVYSIGILLPKIAADFNKADSEVILIASMQVGCYFLSGTIASAFINKYGFRPVAFMGAALSITFLTLATFSINLPMMILFHSILGGPALSMVWFSSQLVIGYYFDKYRPIANGASCSGAGAGIMLFSLMNSLLLDDFGWRNLMRLHVVFLVVVLLMTLSFVEVAPTRIGKVKEPLAEDTESESLDVFYGLTNYSRFSLKLNNQEYPLDMDLDKVIEKSAGSAEKPSTCCSSRLQKCCPLIKRCLDYRRDLKAKEEVAKRYVIKQDPIERHDLFYSGPKYEETENVNAEDLIKAHLNLRGSIDSTDSKRRILSLEEIDNTYKRNTVIRTLSSRRILPDQESRQYRLTYAQLKDTVKRPILAFLSPQNWLHPKIQKALRLLFDFRLLDIMEFRILLLSAFLFPMGFNIPFVYSTVRAQIDASLARLITPTIGFSNFAFRIASGFVAFKFREYTTYICGGGMFFGGFAVFVSAFYGLDVVWFQFLYAVCYGIAPAFFSTLRAIIYVRALGLEKLTNAYGLTALAMGLGVFIGTTAGGILNDLTSSYTASFAFAGICICSAGALKMLLPHFTSVSKGRATKRNN